MAFVLTPAKAHYSIYDYIFAERRRLHESASKSLFSKVEGFDCKPKYHYDFMELFANRGQEYNWDFCDDHLQWTAQRVLMVAIENLNNNANTDSWYFINHLSQVKIDQLTIQAGLYMDE